MKKITLIYLTLISFTSNAEQLHVNTDSASSIDTTFKSRTGCVVDNDDFFSGIYTLEEITGSSRSV